MNERSANLGWIMRVLGIKPTAGHERLNAGRLDFEILENDDPAALPVAKPAHALSR
ncbi:MAG: hypothetical protein WBX25_08405 [Rhodomicrobium sp.]